ncbi:MAG: hypothetical protein IIC60_06350 [Proteobacteria bacterium]|nr:hypothetical protein [Pseudomonadota bacterium]
MLKQRITVVVTTILMLAFSTMEVSGQSLSSHVGIYQAPHTAWGHPDLQGIWDRRTITPLERPQRLANKAFLSPEEIIAYERASAARADGRPLDSTRRGISVHDPSDLDYGTTVVAGGQTSLIVDPADGRIPAYTQASAERVAARARAREGRGPADSWLDRSLTERCITWGIPNGMLPQAYNNNIQILQTPSAVLILNEMVHDIRIVPIDGRPHIPENIRQWHGDPRGHWEGDTLVVESTNFSGKTNFRRASENLRLVERFTRTGSNTLQYEFTVEDSTTWVQPWTVSFPMIRGDQPIYEFACHEGNHGLENILRIARNLEQQAAQ